MIFFKQFLATKITSLYDLARDHLSKQTHYDWGLRSIVATLKMAANLRQINADVSETVIVLRALRDVNLSKLVGEDGLLFYGLLRVCCCYLLACLSCCSGYALLITSAYTCIRIVYKYRS